jgi:hypothetical protein
MLEIMSIDTSQSRSLLRISRQWLPSPSITFTASSHSPTDEHQQLT